MEFKPTWLYVKRCGHCGLLYFGKTTLKDPVAYAGSGTYWNNHINKHGRHLVETLVTRLFKNEQKIQRHAVRFSKKHDVANSKLWANLREEDGIGAGGAHSETTKRKMSRDSVGRGHWYTDGIDNVWVNKTEAPPSGMRVGRSGIQTLSESGREKCRQAQLGVSKSRAHRRALSAAARGKPKSPEHIAKIAESKRGQSWYNDGIRSFQLSPYDTRVCTLVKGRLPSGKAWFTDGVQSFLLLPTDRQIKRNNLQPGRVF